RGGRDVSGIPLTAAWVAAAAGGRIVAGGESRGIRGVSIDTRTIGGGDLFVALPGERFDGAGVAAAAIDAGAGRGSVPPGARGWRDERDRSAKASAERTGRTAAEPPVVIEVDDTTAALQSLAHAVRRESGTKVVAITGSAGKTTTKEVTGEFLESKYRVVRN